MKGAGAGLVLQVARVTPALREASGPLSIQEAARLLNLSNAQVYNWMRTGLPYVRLKCGRGNDKVRIDAAVLRTWMQEARPTVWMPDMADCLDCDPEERERRQKAVWAMLERWGL